MTKVKPQGLPRENLFLFWELSFKVDSRWQPDPHDVMDFHHAIVPSIYCQWVLLDRDWGDHVTRAQRALRGAGVDVPLAMVLAKRSGIDDLIAQLEAA